MTASLPAIGIKRMRDRDVSEIAVARLRGLQPVAPSTLRQAIARISTALATKNEAATAALESARLLEDGLQRAERFSDYRRLIAEADGMRQALDCVTGGTS